MKLKFLNKLADIVVSIDEGKNITDENVVGATDCGIRLIAHMKLVGLDIAACCVFCSAEQGNIGDFRRIEYRYRQCLIGGVARRVSRGNGEVVNVVATYILRCFKVWTTVKGYFTGGAVDAE